MTKYFLVAREVHTKLFKILSFLNFGNNVFVVCAEINLLSYDNHFCAYQVGNSTENVYVKIIQEYKAEVCITYVCIISFLNFQYYTTIRINKLNDAIQ